MNNWLPDYVIDFLYEVFCAYVKMCKRAKEHGVEASSEFRAQMLTKMIRALEGYAFIVPGFRISKKMLDLDPENLPKIISGCKHWGEVKKSVAAFRGTAQAASGSNALEIYIEHPRSITMMIDDIVEKLTTDQMSYTEFAEALQAARPILIHRSEVSNLTRSRATMAEAEAEYLIKVSPLITI